VVTTFLAKIGVAVIREEARRNGWKFVERTTKVYSRFSLVSDVSHCVLSATDVPAFGIQATRITSDELSHSAIDTLVGIAYQEFRLEETATRIVLTSDTLPLAEMFRCKVCNSVLDHDFALYGWFHADCWQRVITSRGLQNYQDEAVATQRVPTWREALADLEHEYGFAAKGGRFRRPGM